jgi:hypothetical protein
VAILVSGSQLSMVDIEVSGAATAAISFGAGGSAALIGSDIHDNPGAALIVQAGATPRITHNVFSRNGMSQNTPATFRIDKGASPVLEGNVFLGVRPDVFAMLDEATQQKVKTENWFLSHGGRP